MEISGFVRIAGTQQNLSDVKVTLFLGRVFLASTHTSQVGHFELHFDELPDCKNLLCRFEKDGYEPHEQSCQPGLIETIDLTLILRNVRLTVIVIGKGKVISHPQGLECHGEYYQGQFPVGAGVTLTAIPADHVTFSGWSGGCQGTGDVTVTLTAPLSVAATFEPKLLPVKLWKRIICVGVPLLLGFIGLVFLGASQVNEENNVLIGTIFLAMAFASHFLPGVFRRFWKWRKS